MTTKPDGPPDLNSLAIEACDMWQEHLSALASDPSARADLTRLLEPQRRMFAEWVGVMQKGVAPEFNTAKPNPANNADAKPKPEPATPASPAPASSGGFTSGDDPLRTAQLALRVAELEKRLVKLEAALSNASRRTQRTAS